MSNLPELTLGNPAPPADHTGAAAQTAETVVLSGSGSQSPPDNEYSLAALTLDEQKIVLEFKDKINIDDTNVVMQYGAAAQTKIAQFSDSVLKNIRTKDMGEVGKSLSSLVVEIKSFDATAEEKTGFLGLFGGAKKTAEKMLAGYNKVEANIDRIENDLEGHKRQLMKDNGMLNTMYDNNLQYFKELTLYIVAGNERLIEYREKDIPLQQKIAEASHNQMETQKLNDMISQADRFEKKLHDLKISRTISIQMAPQIRLLQNNNAVLVEKIQSSIVNSIPLWKNQMVLALGMANSKAALGAQKKVTDMTNEMLVKNSEMLKQGSIEVAKESERSIVSIETIKKTNENLISTINEVLQIQKDGSEKRAAAEGELARIESQLKETLLATRSS